MLRYIILLLLAFNVNAKPFSSTSVNQDINGHEYITIVYKDHRVVDYNLSGHYAIEHDGWVFFHDAIKLSASDYNKLKLGIKK